MNSGTLHYIGVLRCFAVSDIQAMQDLAPEDEASKVACMPGAKQVDAKG